VISWVNELDNLIKTSDKLMNYSRVNDDKIRSRDIDENLGEE
jgi:hypothetical protein